jgi:hypothetical protein
VHTRPSSHCAVRTTKERLDFTLRTTRSAPLRPQDLLIDQPDRVVAAAEHEVAVVRQGLSLILDQCAHRSDHRERGAWALISVTDKLYSQDDPEHRSRATDLNKASAPVRATQAHTWHLADVSFLANDRFAPGAALPVGSHFDPEPTWTFGRGHPRQRNAAALSALEERGKSLPPGRASDLAR